MPLLTGIRKQVLAQAIGAPFLNDVQPPASKRRTGPQSVGSGFRGNQDGGNISSAEHGRQTDLIGAVHLFPSPGNAAAFHTVGWGRQQPRLPEMKPIAGGEGKRKLPASPDPFNLPDVQIPVQKRHAGTRHAGGALQPLGGGGGTYSTAATKD